MKRKETTSKIPLHDYRTALQDALSWLGDRHLLAEPVPRLSEERTPYFAEPRRWPGCGSTARAGRSSSIVLLFSRSTRSAALSHASVRRATNSLARCSPPYNATVHLLSW